MPSTILRRILLLGSTGSIGQQTVDVINHLNTLADRGTSHIRYQVVGLAAGRNLAATLEQARTLGVRELAIADPESARRANLPADLNIRSGPDAAERLVREVDADIVLGAMVGAAGLPATLAALERGLDVALANKETLVAAGDLVTRLAERTRARLFAVDSEHSAIWQCLASCAAAANSPNIEPPCTLGPEVRRIILTASGGALRDKPLRDVRNASPEDALAHPTWSMGAKVTIDSASLMNKALEVIEAHWLFGLEAERIAVVVHPQSIIHSLVEFADGGVIAQLGPPDMRTPIQYALTFPRRIEGNSRRMDWTNPARLDLEPPDLERFPALKLGFRVVREGGVTGAVLNAANERAVEAFLNREIPFGRIPELCEAAMNAIGASPVRSLADVLAADAEARAFVDAALEQRTARALHDA